MRRKMTTQEFISRAQEKHNDRYSYEKASYTGSLSKLTIICTEHGEFTQQASSHLRGAGCPHCAQNSRKESRGSTLRHFLYKAHQAHGDRFDYALVEYRNSQTPVVIICPEHGEFTQTPASHTAGLVGCAGCHGQSRITKDQLIERSQGIFGEGTLDYTLITGDLSHHRKVDFRCVEHDQVFTQEIGSHLKGSQGCPQCNNFSALCFDKVSRVSTTVYDGEEFDFSRTRYDIGSTALNTIGCSNPEHGFFTQSLSGHFSGRRGCKECSRNHGVSQSENNLADTIEQWGFELIRNSRSVIPPYELDIYIPSKNIAIEYNGLYWHSETAGKTQDYHHTKWLACQQRGIQLITIWEDDWNAKKGIVLAMLQHKLGVSEKPRIYARNTIVETLSSPTARRFLNENHIQGFATGTIHLGLYDTNDDLVAVSTWRKNLHTLYLDRYATSAHVVGGLGKLLRHGVSWAIRNNCTEIITFADHQVSDGGLYEKLGFTKDRELKPDYSYIVDHTRRHKFGFRKEKFMKDPTLTYCESASERELADLNGFTRVWDCGKTRFIMGLPAEEET